MITWPLLGFIAAAADEARPLRVLQAGGSVDSLAWSPDSATLAVMARVGERGKERVIQRWDIGKGQPAGDPLRSREAIFSVCWSPDGGTIAHLVWTDGTPFGLGGGRLPRVSEVRLHDSKTAKATRTLSGAPLTGAGLAFTSDLLDLAYSPDGKWIAAGGKLVSADQTAGQHIGGEVCVWEAATEKLRWSDRTTHTDIVYSVAFSPDGRTLASGGIDKLIRLWDVESGKLKATLRGAAWDGLVSLAFSPDGSLIASGGGGREEGGAIRLWNAATGKLTRTLNAFESQTFVRIAFSRDGRSLHAVGQSKGGPNPAWRLRSWRIAEGKWGPPSTERTGHSRAVSASPDGKTLAVGTDRGEVVLLDVRGG